MLMIPLPYLFSLLALFLIWREWQQTDDETRNNWFIAFLALWAVVEWVIGTRFGYGVEALARIQPFLAAVLPPLAYVAFRRTHAKFPMLALHYLPFVCVVLAYLFFPQLIDLVLSITNFAYAFALGKIALQGSNALDWVGVNRLRQMQMIIWLIVVFILFSAITDLIVTYDFWTERGANISTIVTYASLVVILIGAAGFYLYRRFENQEISSGSAEDTEKEKATFARISKLMETERLFMDPDINLSRIARKLTLPVRDVSQAINGRTDQNISQYVNQLRIKEACRMLNETQTPITEIVFACGFNTKSNFNREFTRITSQTPSQWRTDNCKSSAT